MLLGKRHEEFGKFSPEQSKVSKLELWWDSFARSRKCMALEFTEELCVMTMKNHTKIEEELTCHFKIDMRRFTNSDWSTRKSKKFVSIGSLWPKDKFFWATKVQRSYLSWHWRDMQILKKNWLVVWKKTWEIWQIFTRTLESVKSGTLMGSFRPK